MTDNKFIQSIRADLLSQAKGLEIQRAAILSLVALIETFDWDRFVVVFQEAVDKLREELNQPK